MCGRYVAATPTAVLAEEFDVDEVALPARPPSYNVAPTDPVPVVATTRDDKVILREMRWGLVPTWATDTKDAAKRINARAETAESTQAFRAAFQRRRCIVPADGFYEWHRRADGTRQPWFVHRADGRSMAMAGLWEIWGEDRQRTCAVITTSANRWMEPIHDRMPVILEGEDWRRWLAAPDPSLLTPAHPDVLVRHPVSSRVGNVRNNDAGLVEVVPEAPMAPIPLKLL